MKEYRCPCCNKLLFRAIATGKIEIKCNKCKKIVLLDLDAKKAQ